MKCWIYKKEKETKEIRKLLPLFFVQHLRNEEDLPRRSVLGTMKRSINLAAKVDIVWVVRGWKTHLKIQCVPKELFSNCFSLSIYLCKVAMKINRTVALPTSSIFISSNFSKIKFL